MPDDCVSQWSYRDRPFLIRKCLIRGETVNNARNGRAVRALRVMGRQRARVTTAWRRPVVGRGRDAGRPLPFP